MSNAKSFAFVVFFLALLSGIAAGCSNDAECATWQVCVYGTCANKCDQFNPCAPNEKCFDNHCAKIPNTCAVDNEWIQVNPGINSISWIALCFIAILLIMMFLSIAYMCGVLFKRTNWIIWAKNEFYQSIISTIMILVVAWFSLAACEASFAVAQGNPFKVADIYLNNLVWEKTLKIAHSVFMTGIFASITAAFFLPIGAPPGGTRPFAGLNAISGVTGFLFAFVSAFFSSLLMQSILLKIIQALMFKIVLPLGVFFRVFPFLRQAGATFIAIALGFYLVFPMMYVLDKVVYESAAGTTISYENSADLGYIGAVDQWGFTPLIRQVAIMDHVQDVADLIPQAFFLPTLNIVVTYAFIKSVAKMFSQNFPSPFEEHKVGTVAMPSADSLGGAG